MQFKETFYQNRFNSMVRLDGFDFVEVMWLRVSVGRYASKWDMQIVVILMNRSGGNRSAENGDIAKNYSIYNFLEFMEFIKFWNSLQSKEEEPRVQKIVALLWLRHCKKIVLHKILQIWDSAYSYNSGLLFKGDDAKLILLQIRNHFLRNYF